MNVTIKGYPLDRYLVHSSKFEMVNIIDDELWNTDPALKPEDELILRKLHEMLQSTADDLKLLSGELSKYHQPGVQIKTTPTPLDEKFNEKVHIEEIVNAKFHGYKILNKSCTPREPDFKPSNVVTNEVIPTTDTQKLKMCNNNNKVATRPILKKPINKNLVISRAKIIDINGKPLETKSEKLNNGKVINVPVAYKEYTHNYVQPKVNKLQKHLKLQEMPRINIRSELKQQKVLQLDIMPDVNECNKCNAITRNVSVIALQHEPEPTTSGAVIDSCMPIQHYQLIKPAVRKVSKMSTCDSSGSTNNVSTDSQNKLKLQKRLVNTNRSKATKKDSILNRKKIIPKRQTDKRSMCLGEWRKKIRFIYESPTSKNHRSITKDNVKISPSKAKVSENYKQKILNSAEYIPYSKLTIGGARASEIEKIISGLPEKSNIPLNSILDKILSSRENSYRTTSRSKSRTSDNLKVLTTSDENLLQEVVDIERTVSETLSKNIKCAGGHPKPQKTSTENEDAKENESYVDDFEEDKSDHSGQSENKIYSRSASGSQNDFESNSDNVLEKQGETVHQQLSSTSNPHNLTYPKVSNLSFKNEIDIFEYLHAIDTQDSATQSNVAKKITPKETQTTPRADVNLQPIHNELWPSMDPNERIEKMFELEKDFIRKLIVDEYGDILERNITKPSTSKESEITNNVAALQKNTQTSPAHVKNVMTSPHRTKTRTTSPFTTLTIDHQTSPMIFVTNEDVKVPTQEEDLAISINLSSPRFSLRLPRNSQEVLSNLGDSSRRMDVNIGSECRNSAKTDFIKSAKDIKRPVVEAKKKRSTITTSSSSIEADSSEISSLGEVRLRRMLAKMENNSDSESFSSTSSKYSLQSGILPLRSEGEMSMGLNKKSTRHSKSEGEASFGFL